MKNLKTLALAAVLLLVSFGAIAADATTMPDPGTIVSTASTIAYNVGTLVAAVVVFFIGVKIVKWIRK